MRIVGHIPHPSIHISVFMMNEKYIVKLEAGPMEQVYKLEKEQAKGMDDVQKFLSREFLAKALERFNQMFLDMQEELKK